MFKKKERLWQPVFPGPYLGGMAVRAKGSGGGSPATCSGFFGIDSTETGYSISQGRIVTTVITCSCTGNISYLRFYRPTADADSSFAMAVYSYSAGDIDSFLGTTSISNDTTTTGWVTLALTSPIAVTSGSDYGIAYWASMDGTNGGRLARYATDGSNYYYNSGSAVDIESWPASTAFSVTTAIFSFQAGY
jgi:hypothetical protein